MKLCVLQNNKKEAKKESSNEISQEFQALLFPAHTRQQQRQRRVVNCEMKSSPLLLSVERWKHVFAIKDDNFSLVLHTYTTPSESVIQCYPILSESGAMWCRSGNRYDIESVVDSLSTLELDLWRWRGGISLSPSPFVMEKSTSEWILILSRKEGEKTFLLNIFISFSIEKWIAAKPSEPSQTLQRARFNRAIILIAGLNGRSKEMRFICCMLIAHNSG